MPALCEGGQFHAEFQNIFNRLFLSVPSYSFAGPTSPTSHNGLGQLIGGFGYVNWVNGAGWKPRSGQIVARFEF